MRKVGIKYCGGCNPTYNREDVERVIRDYFLRHGIQLDYIQSNFYECDFIILICGCKSCCVLKSLPDIKNILVFDEPEPEEEIIKKIEEVMLNVP